MRNTTVVQISDSHLFGDKQGCLQEVNTYDSLQAVLNDASKRYSHARAFVLSGDLSQDGTAESYHNLKGLIRDLTRTPCFVIPGNHDHIPNMRQHLVSDSIRFERFADFEDWRVHFLNTQVEDMEHGFLGTDEMGVLEKNASERKQNHLICLHHPPVLLNGFIDRSKLQNSDQFFAVLENIQGQKVVIFGHAHQEYVEKRSDLVLLGAPSTCVQFEPHTPECVKHALPPGYRVLNLRDGGVFETEVIRIKTSQKT